MSKSKSKLTKSQQQKLVEKYFAAKDRGKEAYAEADQALAAIAAAVPVGTVIELAGGRTATLIDQFAGKNKVFKPCGVERITLTLSHSK